MPWECLMCFQINKLWRPRVTHVFRDVISTRFQNKENEKGQNAEKQGKEWELRA